MGVALERQRDDSKGQDGKGVGVMMWGSGVGDEVVSIFATNE